MRVALLLPPEHFNVGNAFLSYGGQYLVKKVFNWKYRNFEIIPIEVLDTGISSFKFRSNFTIKYNEKLLDTCDWVIMFGGSCLSTYMKPIFEEIYQIKAKKILLGAGFYDKFHEEKYIYQDMYKYFDYVFVRDQITYNWISNFGKNQNIFFSLDLAFWLDNYKEILLPIKDRIKDYSIVNLDSPLNENLENEYRAEIENCYIMRNNPHDIKLCNQKDNVFIAGAWFAYLRFIANAKEVITNRVHTFVACIVFNVPCRFIFDSRGEYQRYFLIERLGITLKSGELLTFKQYKNMKKIMKNLRTKTESDLFNLI